MLASLFDTQHAAHASQVRRLDAVFGRTGRGLEVGSYAGGFLAAARDGGWMFDGVDVSPAACAFAAGKGFHVTCGQLQDVIATERYDVVAVWNTFEQLHDSRAAVRAARSFLKEGGMLAVRVPSGSFYARWRARLAGPFAGVAERLLAHNNLLAFPYLKGFTAHSMGWLLERAGFSVKTVHRDTLVPVADE
ncbi:MAG: class I SAM-dependent methyltransferase [Gemmatimonadota bacterium]|nr:class I SAM-dependent methyltransferase [Gemmatimonadota bacterium]